MHSEICPCCRGRGTIPNPDDTTVARVICKCCDGRGWVTVPDEYPYYPYPYYPWLPPYPDWTTWDPWGNWSYKITITGYNPKKEKEE